MRETDYVDAERIDPQLDLGRPELRDILDRYVPRVALVVGPGEESALLKDLLVDDGWQIRSCEGPGRQRCPILEGKGTCPLRSSADVAVVYIDGGKDNTQTGSLPGLRCAVDHASPGLVALRGRLDSLAKADGYGIIGALRSPATLAKAVVDVAGADPYMARRTGADDSG